MVGVGLGEALVAGLADSTVGKLSLDPVVMQWGCNV